MDSRFHGFPPEHPRAAVVVAHPDDEILWCGGWMLMHPDWRWYIVALCRASDEDRAPRFRRVLARLGATGGMADLDDGPDQTPIDPEAVRETIRRLLPAGHFDLVLTHGPRGEYTRHRRHEECCRALVGLWQAGDIKTDELRLFAYDDGNRGHLPVVSDKADQRVLLTEEIHREKLRFITEDYGFSPASWEARCTPRVEGFTVFRSPEAAIGFINSNSP
jgi:LmbE family N-acetylglucosaminyl deacetylase